MLSSFIIVFREVLEAALVIGIVAAAVKGVAHRGRWISGGVALGAAGAAMVAAAIGTISSMAHGNGQELFSALVLLLAGAMLAWHNIWMAQHSREMTSRLRSVAAEVVAGNESLIVLVTVTALAVLREGSETALFLYGLVAGANAPDWIAGGVMGLLAGAGVGVVLYLGLSQIPLKRLFRISEILILFIAAGMLARAAQFLVQGGFIPGLMSPIWNTSSIISGNSMLGRSLGALLGYSPAPSLTQFLVYIASLLLIGGTMFAIQRRERARNSAGALAGALLVTAVAALPHPARAGDFQVYSPHVVKGEKELEVRGFNSSGTNENSGAEQALRFAFGYSPTDYWATELYVNAEKEYGESLKVEEYEWENRFQLTPQGKYWADLGLLTELEIPRFSEDPYEFKIGPMISKDFNRLTAQVNLLVARQFRRNSESGVELSYRSRLLYRYTRPLSFELEAYGEPASTIGRSGHSRHYVGGGITGQAMVGAGKSLRYSAVILFGTTQNTANTTVVGRLEYEFY